MFFQKTIYKVKIIDLKKQIIQSEFKSGNLRLKYFLFENDEVAKNFPWRQKNWKSANLPKCTDPVKWECKNNQNLQYKEYIISDFRLVTIFLKNNAKSYIKFGLKICVIMLLYQHVTKSFIPCCHLLKFVDYFLRRFQITKGCLTTSEYHFSAYF